MSLSSHLQRTDLLKTLESITPAQLKPIVIEQGMAYLDLHPQEAIVIEKNLIAFGIDPQPGLIRSIQENVVLHYFEKLACLCGSSKTLKEFCLSTIDMKDAIETLANNHKQGRGALIAVCHFGAVELIGPALLMHQLPVSTVLRFTTPHLSAAIEQRARQLAHSGDFGLARFVEIGKPETVAALEMAAVLRRKDILLAVFDEETEYSVAASLMGRSVKGGAGLDRLLKFANAKVAVYTAFMIRNSDHTYSLNLCDLSDSANPIAAMYKTLDLILAKHLEQWYFLHEEIPFINTNT